MIGYIAQWVFLLSLSFLFFSLGRRYEVKRSRKNSTPKSKAYVVSLQQGNVFVTNQGIRVGVEGPAVYSKTDKTILEVPVAPMDMTGQAFRLQFHKDAVVELEA